MFSRKHLLSCALAGIFACAAANASAQATVTNQPVYFTFDKSVALPGTTLPAGQYEFRLANTRGGDRETIEVYDRTGKHMTTVSAIGTTLSNLQPVPEKAAVRMYEAAVNTPAAVRSWWYPGIRNGHEFLYSRAEARGFAKLNAADGVLVADGNSTVRMKDSVDEPVVAAAAPSPAQTMVDQRTIVSDGSLNARSTPAPVATMAQSTRTALPRTASSLPIVTAVGFLSLIAGLALVMRRRTA